MYRALTVGLALICIGAGITGALAQCADISDAVVSLNPTILVSVLRESAPIDPSLACNSFPVPWECAAWFGGSPRQNELFGTDASGAVYHFAAPPSSGAGYSFGLDSNGQLLERVLPDGTAEPIAEFIQRTCLDPTCTSQEDFRFTDTFAFDVTNGKIRIPIGALNNGTPGCPLGRIGIVELSGIPTMFDVMTTFVPGSSALNIQTPAMPDGFRSADSLQVWTGDIRSMPDWSQAQLLACSAATSPLPGQVVTVADALPDPAVGHGRYYLVASQSGPDRRLGRQYVNGTFSARMPSGLPVCQ